MEFTNFHIINSNTNQDTQKNEVKIICNLSFSYDLNISKDIYLISKIKVFSCSKDNNKDKDKDNPSFSINKLSFTPMNDSSKEEYLNKNDLHLSGFGSEWTWSNKEFISNLVFIYISDLDYDSNFPKYISKIIVYGYNINKILSSSYIIDIVNVRYSLSLNYSQSLEFKVKYILSLFVSVGSMMLSRQYQSCIETILKIICIFEEEDEEEVLILTVSSLLNTRKDYMIKNLIMILAYIRLENGEILLFYSIISGIYEDFHTKTQVSHVLYKKTLVNNHKTNLSNIHINNKYLKSSHFKVISSLIEVINNDNSEIFQFSSLKIIEFLISVNGKNVSQPGNLIKSLIKLSIYYHHYDKNILNYCSNDRKDWFISSIYIKKAVNYLLDSILNGFEYNFIQKSEIFLLNLHVFSAVLREFYLFDMIFLNYILRIIGSIDFKSLCFALLSMKSIRNVLISKDIHEFLFLLYDIYYESIGNSSKNENEIETMCFIRNLLMKLSLLSYPYIHKDINNSLSLKNLHFLSGFIFNSQTDKSNSSITIKDLYVSASKEEFTYLLSCIESLIKECFTQIINISIYNKEKYEEFLVVSQIILCIKREINELSISFNGILYKNYLKTFVSIKETLVKDSLFLSFDCENMFSFLIWSLKSLDPISFQSSSSSFDYEHEFLIVLYEITIEISRIISNSQGFVGLSNDIISIYNLLIYIIFNSSLKKEIFYIILEVTLKYIVAYKGKEYLIVLENVFNRIIDNKDTLFLFLTDFYVELTRKSYENHDFFNEIMNFFEFTKSFILYSNANKALLLINNEKVFLFIKRICVDFLNYQLNDCGDLVNNKDFLYFKGLEIVNEYIIVCLLVYSQNNHGQYDYLLDNIYTLLDLVFFTSNDLLLNIDILNIYNYVLLSLNPQSIQSNLLNNLEKTRLKIVFLLINRLSFSFNKQSDGVVQVRSCISFIYLNYKSYKSLLHSIFNENSILLLLLYEENVYKPLHINSNSYSLYDLYFDYIIETKYEFDLEDKEDKEDKDDKNDFFKYSQFKALTSLSNEFNKNEFPYLSHSHLSYMYFLINNSYDNDYESMLQLLITNKSIYTQSITRIILKIYMENIRNLQLNTKLEEVYLKISRKDSKTHNKINEFNDLLQEYDLNSTFKYVSKAFLLESKEFKLIPAFNKEKSIHEVSFKVNNLNENLKNDCSFEELGVFSIDEDDDFLNENLKITHCQSNKVRFNKQNQVLALHNKDFPYNYNENEHNPSQNSEKLNKNTKNESKVRPIHGKRPITPPIIIKKQDKTERTDNIDLDDINLCFPYNKHEENEDENDFLNNIKDIDDEDYDIDDDLFEEILVSDKYNIIKDIKQKRPPTRYGNRLNKNEYLKKDIVINRSEESYLKGIVEEYVDSLLNK